MNISEFNINDEFIACNHITTSELNPLVKKPYHTKASIFVLCIKGVLKTIINHTQFKVEANVLLAIPPETFVQSLHTSDDTEIYVVIFSKQLIQSAGVGKVMMDKFHIIGKHYIFPLSKKNFQLYAEFMTYLSHLYQRTESPSSLVSLQTLLAYLLQGISELCPEHPRIKETPGSRHFNQYRIFIRLVHTDYVREHQVSYYALKMNMRPAALCRLVKKESGHTAMEIINNTIIMDAKAQLCTANTPIKDIAVSLGFNNAAFFNKFFKRHTGIPPQKFRTSSKQ